MEIWRKYNFLTDLYFVMLKAGSQDFAATGDWTPATGDTKISLNGAAVANTTNNPVAVAGTGSVLWKLTLTAAEMAAALIAVQIVDSATKAVEDQLLLINTYGSAPAQHAFDLDQAIPYANVQKWMGLAPSVLASGKVQTKPDNLGTQAKADVNAEADQALADYNGPTYAEMAAEFDALNDEVSGVPGEVWDEDHIGHMKPGTFGGRLDMPISKVPGAEKQRRGD